MNPGEIEIVDDPAQLAAAREAYAKKHADRLTRLLQNPGELQTWNDEDLGLLRASRERSVARLTVADQVRARRFAQSSVERCWFRFPQ